MLRQKILFYSLKPLLYLISVLPFPVLYFISDALYLIVAKLISYRKKVIEDNLRFAFPDKSKTELENIKRDFYHFFCDLLVESVKLLNMSKADLQKRMYFKNTEVPNKWFEQNRSIVVVLGHMGNWEWAGPGATVQLPFAFQAIYKRLLNPYFDVLVKKLRTSMGSDALEMRSAARAMMQNKSRTTLTVFLMDQRPAPESAFWTDFMHRDAPFYQGPEKIAKKLNYPVMYGKIIRKKRGFYEVTLEDIAPEPALSKPGEITEKSIRCLERDIREQPEMYLWSHKRWKHKRENR